MASYVEIIRLFLSSQTLDFRKNTPAYAGNTSDPSSTIPVFRDHPRLRGEYGRLPVPLIVPVGSPPLARGIRIIVDVNNSFLGITPACAGNTMTRASVLRTSGDHPRLRGEYWCCLWNGSGKPGSPPLARGILLDARESLEKARITPACAGNTLRILNSIPSVRDHPRLRGEYMVRLKSSGNARGSPPLARGIRTDTCDPELTKGITPACAGNTN